MIARRWVDVFGPPRESPDEWPGYRSRVGRVDGFRVEVWCRLADPSDPDDGGRS